MRRSECTHEWQLSSFDIRFWRCAACGAWQYLQDGSHPSQHPMPSRAVYERMNRTTDVTNETPESNKEITTDEHEQHA